jgi:hypothetical protein
VSSLGVGLALALALGCSCTEFLRALLEVLDFSVELAGVVIQPFGQLLQVIRVEVGGDEPRDLGR